MTSMRLVPLWVKSRLLSNLTSGPLHRQILAANARSRCPTHNNHPVLIFILSGVPKSASLYLPFKTKHHRPDSIGPTAWDWRNRSGTAVSAGDSGHAVPPACSIRSLSASPNLRHECVQLERVTTRPQRRHWTVEVPPAAPNPRVASIILKSWNPSRHNR